MQGNGRLSLQVGGGVMIAAALLHVGALFSGAGFIAALGAPENIVQSASQGSMLAPVVISAIAVLLLLVGLSALSIAGTFRPVPLSRPILYITSIVLVLRALSLPLLLAMVPAVRSQLSAFEVLTALLCFALGAMFFLGLRATRAGARAPV